VIDSDESPSVLEDLVRISQNACLAMQAIVNQTPADTQIHIKGKGTRPLD
jgi:hypothetical protein